MCTKTEEINDLVQKGIPVITAMGILDGKIDKAIVLERIDNQQRSEDWIKDASNLSGPLKPSWNLDPEFFYLSFDGESSSDFDPAEYEVIYSDVDNLKMKLSAHSDLSADPWLPRYRGKSKVTAYRWSVGKSVTPALVVLCDGELHLGQGFHRLRLAVHYPNGEVPILVRKSEKSEVQKQLASTE